MPGKKERLTPIPRPRKAKVQASAPAAADPTTIGAAPGGGMSYIAEQLRPLAVRTADLAFLVSNPLDHSDDEVEDMRAVLRRRGQLVPLVINRKPTPPVVLGGNKRLRAMLAEGWEWAAVVDVDLSDDDAAALAIELNATQGQSWNKDLLRKALHQVDKLTLGERTEGLFARLAEAQKLIPKDPPAARQSEGETKRTVTCPECEHEFEVS